MLKTNDNPKTVHCSAFSILNDVRIDHHKTFRMIRLIISFYYLVLQIDAFGFRNCFVLLALVKSDSCIYYFYFK